MEEDSEIALDIISNKIAEITNIYATSKNAEEISICKEKLDVLEKMQQEIYMNNRKIIVKVLKERKKGII